MSADTRIGTNHMRETRRRTPRMEQTRLWAPGDQERTGIPLLGGFLELRDPGRQREGLPTLFSLGSLTDGSTNSTVHVLEGALAINSGKSTPVGYEDASRFFKNSYGRTTPAMNVWLMAEAIAAGQFEQMVKDFPDAQRLAEGVIDDMQRNHAITLDSVIRKVQSPGYGRNTEFETVTTADLLNGPRGIREIEGLIDGRLASEPDLSWLTTTAQALAHPDVLFPLLDQVVNEPDAVSSDHPPHLIAHYGPDGELTHSFDAIPLLRGRDGRWNARLHVWQDRDGITTTQDTHTHAQPFGSVPLVSSFDDVVLEEVPWGQGSPHAVFTNNQQLEPDREASLRPVRRRSIPAGSHHTMPSWLIHNADVPLGKGMVATLVVRGRPAAETGTEFATYDGSGTPVRGTPPWREPIDAKEVVKELVTTLKAS